MCIRDRYKAIYTYTDVLLFEIARVIHGHSLKESCKHMNVEYHTVLRTINAFDKGQSSDKLMLPKKSDAYTLSKMVDYILESANLLKHQTYDEQYDKYRTQNNRLV